MLPPSEQTDADAALPTSQRSFATIAPLGPYGLMVLAGLAAGIVAALVLFALTPAHWPTLGSQAQELRASLAVLQHGGPLLLGRHGSAGPFYAIGTDEEGPFVYFPFLSHLFGVADPVSMERYVYIFLFALGAAIYPPIFYKLTNSTLAGFFAPIALLVCVRSMGFNDVYWIPAWGALTLLPLIYLFARDWPRLGLLALTGISLTAGWASSVRAGSGLAIVVTAAIVLLLRRWAWWRLLPSLALLALMYISINSFVFPAIVKHRDERIGARATRALEREEPSPHIWHTMYIGLGYLPNDYRIRYEDGVAAARVQHDAPGTRYLSARYDTVIRRAYFSVVRHHPLEVLKQYAAKVLVTAADTAPYLLILLLTAPAMLLIDPERSVRRLWLLITLPAIVLAALQALIAIPLEPYEQGLYGVLGAIGIVGLCWMLAKLETQARLPGGLRSRFARPLAPWSTHGKTPSNPYRRSATISGAALIALIMLVVAGHFISRSAERWQGYSAGVLIAGVESGRDRA
jgi:hypothetical protein